MKKILSILLILGFVAGTQPVSAQEDIKEGKVTFEIEVINAEEMNDQMLAMMPKELVVYFKDGKSRGEMDMMGGKMVTLSDDKTEETITLMDLMGRKQAIKTTKGDMENERAKMGEYEVKVTDETRMIAGYKCKKAIIVFKDSTENKERIVWFTKDLKAVHASKYSWKGIDGYMLEFTVDQRGMGMKFTCKEVKAQPVADELFVIPEGYTIMTQEEMSKQFGGGQ